MLHTLAALACMSAPALAPWTHPHCGCDAELSRIAALVGQDPPQLDPGHKRDLDRDVELGKKYAAYVDENMKASEKADYVERVQRIGAEMAKISNAHQPKVSWGDRRHNVFDYQFKVLAGEDINAFSLPGGFIYVYEGLVDYTESDHELAGVLAHEVAHASLRHLATLEREQRRFNLLTLPAVLVMILTQGKAGAEFVALGQLVGTAAGSGWSQNAENAADYAGLQYIMRSDYNPVGLLTFMERLVHDDRNRPHVDWGIFRTHPPSKERAENITKHLLAADVAIRRSEVTNTYRAKAKGAEKGSGIDVWFNSRRIFTFSGADAQRRADEAASRLNAFFDEVPDLFEVRGQSDGKVTGRRRVLIEVTPEDAEAAGIPVAELATQTEQNIKGALFMLGYRVWSRR
jgi:beta-barrel assembly-enhancing protease